MDMMTIVLSFMLVYLVQVRFPNDILNLVERVKIDLKNLDLFKFKITQNLYLKDYLMA